MTERLYVIAIALSMIMGLFIMKATGFISFPDVITLTPFQVIGGVFLVFVMFFVGKLLI